MPRTRRNSPDASVQAARDDVESVRAALAGFQPAKLVRDLRAGDIHTLFVISDTENAAKLQRVLGAGFLVIGHFSNLRSDRVNRIIVRQPDSALLQTSAQQQRWAVWMATLQTRLRSGGEIVTI